MRSKSTSSAILSHLIESDDPFAIIQRQGADHATIFQGDMVQSPLLRDIPRKSGIPASPTYDTVSMIPFSQVRERPGFQARSEGEKILCLSVRNQTKIAVKDLITSLPEEIITLIGDKKFSISDEQYARDIARAQRDEIGNGEVSNIVLSRIMEARIADMSRAKLFSIYRALLGREYGSYMNYLFSDGEHSFVAASPERHLSVRQGIVKMNPISGTLRKLSKLTKEQLLAFLRDPKEVHELFMVLDEELKQMAQMCEQGGEIQGPFLKEMSKVIHTEFMLVGRSDLDPMEIFPHSMFAPTVTGGPMKNACSLIVKYEPQSRRYYAGAILLNGRDSDGSPMLDSAINIRLMEISRDGTVRFQAGSTIVRDSDPEAEVKESNGKVAGPYQALTSNTPDRPPEPELPTFLKDSEVQNALDERMQKTSSFLAADQAGADHFVEALKDKRITIVKSDDDFAHTLGHMIERMGADVTVVPYQEYTPTKDDSDLVIVGPGTGDPNNMRDRKMRALASILIDLDHEERPFIAICLGHQLLSKMLGMQVERKEDPAQGVPKDIDFFGVPQRVGFYNTFAAKRTDLPDIDIAADPETGEVHALRGKHFSSFQFHPESVLSENGFDILRNELVRLLRGADQ